MGALALVATFVVGLYVFKVKSSEVLDGFPASLFVILVGVTYLFALAKNNGTVDWIVHASVRAVGGRVALVPWAMFFVTAAVTSIGAVSPAAVAIIAPVALGFAATYRIHPVLMGMFVVQARRPDRSPRSASSARSPTASCSRASSRATRSSSS